MRQDARKGIWTIRGLDLEKARMAKTKPIMSYKTVKNAGSLMKDSS